METARRIPPEAMTITGAKDELNLAEFPLCVPGHRPVSGQKTLRFQDRIWDRSAGDYVTRQLTITGSDAYGLPTALDDDVLLGLVQLSRQQGFRAPRVPFTRYQLIRLLGWRDESKSYERIDTSLNRWTGVTLFYANAWRNKERGCWVDEKFHVLDNVRLHRRRQGRGSSFVWNEVLFESFRSGNLKSLDFEFFRRLRTPTAKRLYRFLDKRFHRRRRCEFSLKELAWEHVGLARSYDVAGLKRRLRPGIEELEERGFLEAMGPQDRCWRVCTGEWRIRFEKAASRPRKPQGEGLAGELMKRGVDAVVAERMVSDIAADQIRRQVEAFDGLKSRESLRNPAGYLIRAIEGDYAPPKGSVHERSAQKPARCTRVRGRKRRNDETRHREERVSQFWASLSPEAAAVAEEEALSQMGPFQRRLIAAGGSAGAAARQAALDAYARNRSREVD